MLNVVNMKAIQRYRSSIIHIYPLIKYSESRKCMQFILCIKKGPFITTYVILKLPQHSFCYFLHASSLSLKPFCHLLSQGLFLFSLMGHLKPVHYFCVFLFILLERDILIVDGVKMCALFHSDTTITITLSCSLSFCHDRITGNQNSQQLLPSSIPFSATPNQVSVPRDLRVDRFGKKLTKIFMFCFKSGTRQWMYFFMKSNTKIFCL